MVEEEFQSVDFMLASFKRLRKFAQEIKEEVWELACKGDLD